MKRFYILIIIFSYVKSFSQDIQNVNFTFNNNVFYITYDLLNCSSLNTNDIKITFEGKTTGYYTPVNVSGDIFNQSCSTNKKIIWSPLTEGKQIKEEVRFIVEIRENKKLIKNEQSNSNIKEQTLYNNKNVVNNKSLSTIKVAHVNTQKLLDTLPSRKVALSQISDFEKKGVAELKDMEAELQKIYSKYLQDKDKLTPVDQQYEEERIQKKNQAIQQREQELQQQIRSLGEELNSPILKRVQKAVDIIADRKKINYVIDETATIYFKDGIDLTSEVMVELLKLELNLSNNQTLKKENQINDESKTDEPKKIITVAHVNTQKLLDTMPSRKVALSQISDFEKKGVAELKDMEAELQKIYSKYLQDKDKLTPVHQQYEEERIQKKNQAMQQREQELQQQIRSLGEELNSPILKRVQKAVDIIADRKKINYVIDETATIYFKDGIDLTSEVMVELLKLDLNLSNNQTLKKENQINDESKTDEPKKIITVAHVNTQKLLDTMPSRKLALSQISDFEKKGVAELKDMEAELQKIYSKYLQDKDKLTPVVQQYEEERIQKKNQAMQQREQEIQQQIRSLGEELNSPILKRVQKAVDIIADRKKINYVIDETTTIYFKDGIDLTSEVLLELLELDSIELIQKK